METRKRFCDGWKELIPRRALIFFAIVAVIIGGFYAAIPKYPSGQYAPETYEAFAKAISRNSSLLLPPPDALPESAQCYTVNAASPRDGFPTGYIISGGDGKTLIECWEIADSVYADPAPYDLTIRKVGVYIHAGDPSSGGGNGEPAAERISFLFRGYQYVMETGREGADFSLEDALALAEAMLAAQ